MTYALSKLKTVSLVMFLCSHYEIDEGTKVSFAFVCTYVTHIPVHVSTTPPGLAKAEP